MPVSRRRFLSASAAGAAAAGAVMHVSASEPAPAAPGAAPNGTNQRTYLPLVANTKTATVSNAPPEVIALNRMAYGPRPGDLARVRQIGVDAYIDEQLNPNDADDPDANAWLAAARLKIKYGAASNGSYAAVNQARGLELLNKKAYELWSRANYEVDMDWSERQRPFEEVRAATFIRAVHSKWQLREVMVEFWHNHFNVNAGSDTTIAAGLPEYDQIMRRNCFGNFRTFVEEVGRSVAMMFYLDNRSNKAGGGEGGNENYARELFELHTLGSDHYLKFYADRAKIEVVEYNGEKFTKGYIDDDIYEASRCFTGWTIGHGNWELENTYGIPNDGKFHYVKNWHDDYPKTVLAVPPPGYAPAPNIPARQADEVDGEQVYNLVGYHIATARNLCKKLCRRLVGDNPPQSLIDAAVAEWMANRTASDQIKKVLRVILRSNEFKSTYGQKLKRPFEHMIAFMRATNAQFPIDQVAVNGDANRGGYWGGLLWNYSQGGHKLYEWPTPTGHPDVSTYWASTNGMLRRWNLPFLMAQDWGGNVEINLVSQTNMNSSCIQIVDFWIDRLFGYSITPTVRQALIDFMAQKANGGDPNQPPKKVDDEWEQNAGDVVRERLFCMLQLMAMTPDYQLR